MFKKRKYEKPILKGEKLFEAGTKACCKVDAASCTKTDRGDLGKSSQTTTTS